MSLLKVWGRKTSSNVQALIWCIEELGLAYERFDVGHKFGGLDTQDFYELNRNRTIPVLQDGHDKPLWETACILRYLASRYGPESFWPSALLERTQVDLWAEWSKLNIAIGFTQPVFWRVVRTPLEQRDAAAIKIAIDAFERKLLIAEQQLLEHPFLAGSDFTLADIQFGHVLFRYYDIDIVRKPLPQLAAYYARLRLRPAFLRHVMISYDELRA